jgi:predicted flap endonuclease-1-like 5' DNA nuclease
MSMGLFEKLKSLIGLDEPTEETTHGDRDVGITVEREGDGEHARHAGRARDADATDGDGGAESDGGSSTGSATGGGPSASDTTATTGSESDTATAADAAPTPDADADDEAAERRVPSEAVDVIKGIGPTYAGRLSDAGIETVADLAAADAGEVVEQVDIPESRLEEWVERAKNRSR